VALQAEESRGIANLGLRRMRGFRDGVGDIFESADLQSASDVLWRWRDLLAVTGEGPGELQAYLKELLRTKPAHLPNVLALAAGWGSEGPSLEGILPRDDIRRSLDEAYGTDELIALAKTFHARASGASDPFDLVPQFLRIFDSSGLETDANDA
jgi:hypothetical protein